MNISIISNTSHTCPPKGWGGEIFTWDLAEALSDLGHNITLYAPIGSKRPKNGTLVEIPLCDPNPPMEVELYQKYKNDLMKSDFVHDMSHTKIFINSLYRDGYKNAVCTFFGFSWNQKARNILVPSESSRFAAAHGLNGFEGTIWYNSVGYTGQNASVRSVLWGTNTNFYVPEYNKSNYFLYFGGLAAHKGIMIGIQLAKEMGFDYVIACGKPDYPIYEEIKQHILKIIKGYPNITYIELPDNEMHQYIKRDIIQSAKAFLFPVMYREGFGLVAIESLACATPLITSNHGSMIEIVKHCETGFLCLTLDDLKFGILNINKINLKKCREDVVARFDRSVMAKNHLKIYEEVMAGAEW